jgi:hypothetical protein
MKKLAIGLLLVLAGIGTVGVAALSATTHTAHAASTDGATFSDRDSASSSSSGSSRGDSFAAGGDVAKCPHHFKAIEGTCSVAEP